MREIWNPTPDLRPYTLLTPAVSLTEQNPSAGRGARQSQRLDLAFEDQADEDLFNRILWSAIKGDTPYPGIRRMAPAQWKRGQ